MHFLFLSCRRTLIISRELGDRAIEAQVGKNISLAMQLAR